MSPTHENISYSQKYFLSQVTQSWDTHSHLTCHNSTLHSYAPTQHTHLCRFKYHYDINDTLNTFPITISFIVFSNNLFNWDLSLDGSVLVNMFFNSSWLISLEALNRLSLHPSQKHLGNIVSWASKFIFIILQDTFHAFLSGFLASYWRRKP